MDITKNSKPEFISYTVFVLNFGGLALQKHILNTKIYIKKLKPLKLFNISLQYLSKNI